MINFKKKRNAFPPEYWGVMGKKPLGEMP